MEFKIDTNSNHRLINVFETHLNDQLADQMSQLCTELSAFPPYNLIFVFHDATTMEEEFIARMADLHEQVYGQEVSIVFTYLKETLYHIIRNTELGSSLNITPTIQEAIDIVSMEVLERDLLNEEE